VFFVTLCTTPRGENQLAVPKPAATILESVSHTHRIGIWWAHVFLLMPDHAHALLSIAPDRTLAGAVRAWKSWQTKMVGIRWQSGFFDHRLRSDESHEQKAHYIRQNPVRAGLVADAQNWPYVWSALSQEELGSPGGFALPSHDVTSR
jgi:putative transposase